MLFWQKKLLSYLVFSLLFLIASCSSKETVDQAFKRKYGQEISRINAARGSSTNPVTQKTSFPLPTAFETMMEESQRNGGYHAYADINKFGQQTPREFFPNAEVYQNRAFHHPQARLPHDMFEIGYKTDLHPPFHRFGLEFDRIKVPPKDVYGVETQMAEKQYLLAGNGALQNSVDLMHDKRGKDDVEFSEILISESKKLKREQKMARLMGEKNAL